jgi:nitrogen fixation protein NifU and related proteins
MTEVPTPNDLLDVDPLMMDILLDHYRHPHNHGPLPEADVQHSEGNPSCGDQLEIALKTQDGRIQDIKFQGKGCIISQAAASILTDMVKGEPLERVKELTKDEMLENIGIPIGPMRLKCALLALKVLKAGVYGQASWPGEEED